MLVTSIVPRIFPMIDGVGDYALNLARQLRANYGIETRFIVGDPNWHGEAKIDGFVVEKVSVRSTRCLLSLIDGNTPTSLILLQYVGHGYMKRGGSPFWLVQALEAWRRKMPNARLVTMFHEIYASSKIIHRSDFWFSPLQKHLLARVVRLSDRGLTSCQKYADVLHSLSGGKHGLFPTLAIMSNVGEPQSILPLIERKQRLIVFGRHKLGIYTEAWLTLQQICQKLEIEEIWDIGPPAGIKLPSGEIPVIQVGQKTASEISEILSNSIAGFQNYDASSLARSGVFAAYCAHGVVPINYQSQSLPIDGITPGIHYWNLDAYSPTIEMMQHLQVISDAAYAWYQTHNLSIQAKRFATYLLEP